MQNAESQRQTGKSGWLVCFALKEEAAPFRKIAAGKSYVAILLTGIGRRNAEESVRKSLAINSPELVLTCGFAGGLNPTLKLGDVVFEAQSPESKLQSLLLSAGTQPVTFMCADRIAVTAADKKKLRDETGADAVEMESAAIHAVCGVHGIPCITVRVISDTANEDLPLDFNQLSKPDKSLDYGKLLWTIAKSPGKTRALIKLQKQTRIAAERLAEVLARMLPEECLTAHPAAQQRHSDPEPN